MFWKPPFIVLSTCMIQLVFDGGWFDISCTNFTMFMNLVDQCEFGKSPNFIQYTLLVLKLKILKN